MHIANSLTITGSAELARVAEGTIRAAIKRGELSLIPSGDGRVKLLDRKAVEQWAKKSDERLSKRGRKKNATKESP